MFARLGRDAGSLLGVEIASGSVRMLHVRRQRGRCRVAGWAFQLLEPLPGEGAAALLRALGLAHRRCATRQRQVALALPASQVICKVCQLPQGASEQALEAQLLAEADQLFPFPLDDLALDFQVLGPSVHQPGQSDVLVAACRQSQLDPIEQLFAQAGLEVVAMEVDSFALQRAIAPDFTPGTAIVQVEADQLVLYRWYDRLAQRQHLPLVGSARWCEGVVSLLQLGSGQVEIDEVVLVGSVADTGRAAHLSQLLGKACRVVALHMPASSADQAQVPGASMALAYGLALGGLR